MKKIITLLALCAIASFINAEGSKQFLTNPTDSVNACQLNIYSTSSGTGSIMNCPEFKRIYIHISNPATEKIDVGFKNTNATRYYRIFDPNGNLFVAGTLLATTGSGAGRIPFCLQNIQGPSNTLLTGGYVPNVYTPTMTGDYWIEFNRDNNFTSQVLSAFSLTLWDITVVNTTTVPFTPINGRVHCKTWNLFTGNNPLSMKAITYAYTTDSIIHRIDFNGTSGANWTLSMNSFGCTNIGTVANNRKSITGDASAVDTLGQYPLFFNLPDTTFYQITHTPLQLSFAASPLTGCSAPLIGVSQCINIITNKPGVIDLLINLNGVAGYQAGTADVLIPYAVVPGVNCLPWNGLNGLGAYVPAGTVLSMTATIQVGITHIPLFDVEENPNGFIVQCIYPSSIANTPLLYYDDSNLGAGSNTLGCASPCHTWAIGTGNNNTINTWFYGTYLSTVTTAVGPSYAPQFTFTQTNPDCANNLANGAISYNAASPYSFLATDSIGIYQSPLTAPASYQIVALPHTFTSLNAGTYFITIKNALGCVFTSTITLTAIGLPTTAVAGPNQSLCTPVTSATMAANTPTTGTGGWSQVSGPLGAVITNTLSPTSTITGLVAGTYVFKWSIVSGICPPSTSNVTVILSNQPTTPVVSSNTPVCVGSPINLSANAGTGITYSWTGPNGYTSSTQNPVIPNAALIQAGTYTVVASAGTCTPVNASTTVVINSLPVTPTASSNSPVCAGNPISLNTPLSGGNTYQWAGPLSYTSSQQNPIINSSTTTMSGTYSVTVTDANTGCISFAGTTPVIVNLTPATPTITANTLLCAGATLNLNATSTANSTYSWTGPNAFSASTQSTTVTNINASQAGTYSVVATLGNCPSAVSTTTVVVNPLPATPSATSNSPVCAGATLLLSTPILSGFTYSWSGPPAFTSSQQNPALNSVTTAMAGTYSLAVTNTVTGCTSLAGTTLVVINPLPATPIATSNSPVCSGNTINFNTAVTGVNYSWTGPNSFTSSAQSPSINNSTTIMSGTYSLTVTNTVTGCTSLVGTTNLIVNLTPATPTVTSNSPVCAGVSLTLNSGSNPNSTYSWTGPNSYSSSAQNPTITNVSLTQAGTYSVVATLGLCPSAMATITVVVNPLPATPIVSSNSPVCTGNTINLNTPTTSGVSYSWTGPNTFSSSFQNPSIINATTAMSGTYSITATNTVTGCISLIGTTPLVVDITPATPTVTSNSPVCAGGAITLNATSTTGSSYAWVGPNSFSSFIQSVTITNVTLNNAGTYSVVATLGSCPSSIATTTVIINALPATPLVTSNSPICLGSTLALNTPSLAGFTYIWSGPNQFNSSIQNPSISSTTLAMAGTYSLSITDSLTGCASLAGTTIAVINALPATPTATSNSARCAGDTLLLFTSNVSNATYSWTGPLSYTSSNQNPIIPSSTIPMSGTYSITVTDNTTGCTSIDGITNVIVNLLPSILSVTSNTPCVGATLTLTVTAVNGANYVWSGPNSFSSNTQNPSIANVTASDAGIYYVYATLGTCTSPSFTTNVTINTLPVTPTPTSNSAVCMGDTILLFSPNLSGYTYSWTGPNTFSSSLQNPSITNSNAVNGGTYSLTVTDGVTGCTSLAGNTLVVINTLPTTPAATSNSPICIGNTINLSAASVTGFSYSWTGPNGFASTQQSPSLTNASTVMAGNYNLTVTDGTTGCTSIQGTTLVVINPLPATPTASSNSPVCYGDTLYLFTPSQNNYSYSWIGPNGFVSSSQNPFSSNVTEEMIGSYTLTITDGTTGCRSAEVETIISIDCPTDYTIPNVFTPNGDGQNEVFYIKSHGVKSIEGEIYDRWGLKMYSWSSVTSGWDGKNIQGSNSPEGTYFYIITITSYQESKKVEKGSFMLLR